MAKLVSKVYGDALFEAALEDNRLSGLSDEVTAVKEIIAANDDLSKLMDHPQIDKEEKVRIIEEIFGKSFSGAGRAYEDDYRKESLQRAYLSLRLLS